jgi:predicted branched-subunit amino acid permease
VQFNSMTRPSAGFFKALRDPPTAPAAVLCLSFVGFGALCHSVNLGLGPALYTTVFVFALPGQVILVDHVSRGLSLWAAALAVAFTGVRLLPMTVALMPHLRAGRKPRALDYVAAHFVAVTMWIESMRRIPGLPRPMRMPYFMGLGVILVGVSVAGTIAGYIVADRLPATGAAALIFLTPAYFFLGLLGNARSRADYAPIFLGIALAPVLMGLIPSFDLVLTGLVAGTASFLIFRRGSVASRARPIVEDVADGL